MTTKRQRYTELYSLLYTALISSALECEASLRTMTMGSKGIASENVICLRQSLVGGLREISKDCILISVNLDEITNSAASFAVTSVNSDPKWTLIVSNSIQEINYFPKAKDSVDEPNEATFFAAFTSFENLTCDEPCCFDESLFRFFFEDYQTIYPIKPIYQYNEPYLLSSRSRSGKTVHLGLQLWHLRKDLKNPKI